MISTFIKKTLALLIGFLFVVSTNLTAQVEKKDLIRDAELTIEEAIQVALANSPQINRALLSVKDANQLVKLAYSEVLPDIASSISYTRNIEIPVSYLPAQIFDDEAPPGTLIGVPFGTDNNWQGGFSVSQNIFKGDALVGLSTSTIFKTVQQENLRYTSQQVITQTRAAYYQVLVAKEQLRLQEAQIKRLEQNLRENKVRQEAGLVDSYDVLRLEVQLSNQRPQRVEAEYAVDEAYRNLKITLGLPLAFEFKVTGNLNEFDILAQESTVPENAHLKKVDQMNPYNYQGGRADSMNLVQHRGDLRVLDANLNLKDKEISAIKSRFLPVITASYNLQWSAAEPGTPNFFQNPEPNTSPNRFQTLGINLSLPIFQGLQRVANLQRAQIERKDIEEQKRLARLNAQSEVASAAESLNKAYETAEARKQALAQAEEGYTRALKRFENGLGSQIEVTEAEVQVREAEVNYALMVYEYLNAKAQYDLATGKVPYVDTDYIE